MRTASEIEPRNNSQSKSRNPKRQKLDTDGTVDSPGPSPGAPISAAKVKATTVRAGSVPIVKEPKELKEPVVKAEEGSEGVKGPSAEKAGKFFIGAEVAYRLAKAKEDPQWIQCEIINIHTTGNKKRYVLSSGLIVVKVLTVWLGMRYRIPSLMTTDNRVRYTTHQLRH